MAKDPAFLFYVTDFNDGTQDFTNEEVGAYLRILLFQFSQGALPLERIKRKLGADFEKIWPMISSKFSQDEQGNFFNARLKYEQEKRKNYSESRRNNIAKRYEKDMNNISDTYEPTYVQHMENENVDVIVIDNKVKNKEKELQNFSPEFKNYLDWAARNFPDLLKFKKPLTDQQLHDLFDEFKSRTLVREKLEAIGNTNKSHINYTTVYATCRNWCKRELKNGWKEPSETGTGNDVYTKTLNELRRRDKSRLTLLNQQNETN